MMSAYGPRTTCGIMTAALGKAIEDARRRRDDAMVIANRYPDNARSNALRGLDSVWCAAVEAWERFLCSDPACSESVVIGTFARVAPEPRPYGESIAP